MDPQKSSFLNNCNQAEESLEGSVCFGRACNGIWDKESWNRSGASGSQKNRPYGGMLGENAALFEELYSTVQSSTFIHIEDTHMLACIDSLVNGLTTSRTSTYVNALR